MTNTRRRAGRSGQTQTAGQGVAPNLDPSPTEPATTRPTTPAAGRRHRPQAVTSRDEAAVRGVRAPVHRGPQGRPLCSPACRQRAARARAGQDDLQREIDATRARYWRLVRLQAERRGLSQSQIVTEQAQFVAANGDAFMGGPGGGLGPGSRLVAHTTPARAGGSRWGLEAAGPPFSPPTKYMHELYGSPP
jgi:hypothetical protein